MIKVLYENVKGELFRKPASGIPAATYVENGAVKKLAVGSHFPVLPSYRAANRPSQSERYGITVSRCLCAVTDPEFTVIENNNFVKGSFINPYTKDEDLFCYDKQNNVLRTTADTSLGLSAKMTIYPLVVAIEKNSADMRDFRAKSVAGIASLSDCLKYGEHAYYALFAGHDDNDVILSIKDKLPATEFSVQKTTSKTTTPTAANTKSLDNVLPWHKKGVVNDCTVKSALAGTYRLPLSFGVITADNGQEYDMAAAVPALSELDSYVDNATFRKVVRTLCGHFASIVRKYDIKTAKGLQKALDENAGAFAIDANMMLTGEPGTGKTVLARMVAATFGLPCHEIHLDENSEESALTEEVRVSADSKTGFEQRYAAFSFYIQNPGIIILDDFSNADPGKALAWLGSFLEAPFQKEIGHKVLKRNAANIVIATANVGTSGSNAMNEAVLTRFQHLVMKQLPRDSFIDCIKERSSYMTGISLKEADEKKISGWAYDVYAKVQQEIRKADDMIADRLLTLRQAVLLAAEIKKCKEEGFTIDPKEEAKDILCDIFYAAGYNDLSEKVRVSIDGLPNANL